MRCFRTKLRPRQHASKLVNLRQLSTARNRGSPHISRVCFVRSTVSVIFSLYYAYASYYVVKDIIDLLVVSRAYIIRTIVRCSASRVSDVRRRGELIYSPFVAFLCVTIAAVGEKTSRDQHITAAPVPPRGSNVIVRTSPHRVLAPDALVHSCSLVLATRLCINVRRGRNREYSNVSGLPLFKARLEYRMVICLDRASCPDTEAVTIEHVFGGYFRFIVADSLLEANYSQQRKLQAQ